MRARVFEHERWPSVLVEIESDREEGTDRSAWLEAYKDTLCQLEPELVDRLRAADAALRKVEEEVRLAAG